MNTSRDIEAALMQQRRDWIPLLLVPAACLAGIFMTPSTSTWITLTAAGLAMGMMLFIMSSGLTVVFGLMDVLNFGHSAFITVGAYSALVAISATQHLSNSPFLIDNVLALLACVFVAAVAGAIIGLAFERIFVRRVYGDHLKQILVTMGGLIIVEQIILMIWGPQERLVRLPQSLQGSISVGGAAIEKYRIFVAIVGLALFGLIQLVLARTRIGLLVRAGVEDPEMVRALGYRIRSLFVGVFIAGAALASLGGVMWVFYRGTLTAGIGSELLVLIFIVIVSGGLGSIGGCFVAAVLVCLVSNYMSFLVPNLAIVSAIIVMVAVLLWRPFGLYPVGDRK